MGLGLTEQPKQGTKITLPSDITLEEYRKYPGLNYSNIKCIADEEKGVWYYKKHYIDKEPIEEAEDQTYVRRGNLIDDLLFSPEKLDTDYYISTVENRPTGKQLDFTQKLFDYTIESIDEDGTITHDFMESAQKAYDAAECKTPKFENFMEKWKDSNANNYYDELLGSYGKTLVTIEEMTNAEKVVDKLRTNQFTKYLFEGEYAAQHPIVFEYQGWTLKGLLDMVVMDHQQLTIQPLDLKSTYSVKGFPYTYLKMHYYVQQAIYETGIREWAKKYYPDYTVLPFMFLVTDSIGHKDPLIYRTNEQMLQNALSGFVCRGRFRKGLNGILADLEFAKENDIWRIDREDFLNEAHIKLWEKL
jgi:hypothetical protein